MKRSGFKPRSTPMSRGTSTFKQRTPMRTKSRPKMTPIRKSAKNEDCLIQLNGVCNFNPETVVWCHENSYEAGKGMGLKARDTEGAYGCDCCHKVYDRQVPLPSWLTREYVDQRFAIAKEKSREKLMEKNLLEA